MAIYVPPSRRRRQVVLLGVIALVVGAMVGVLLGRATAPSVADRVRSSQRKVVELTAGLRVVTIHQEADTASLQASSDAGAGLALRRAESELRGLLAEAPWIAPARKTELLALVHDLQGGPPGQASTPQFAQRVEAAAEAIETTFGVRSGA